MNITHYLNAHNFNAHSLNEHWLGHGFSHRSLRKLLAGTALACGALLTSATAAADELLIKFKSDIYETTEDAGVFTIAIAGTEGSYVDIDMGFGPAEYELVAGAYDSEAGEIKATAVTCRTSAEGIVSIYGEPGTIEYLNAEGCGIEWIEFSDPASLRVLNLSHNSLKRLDVSALTALEALYLTDNAYDESPLVVGANHPELQILEIAQLDAGAMAPGFNISNYPKLLTFDAHSNHCLTAVDPTGCPNLMKLSLDCTEITSIDVTKNPILVILNVSETGVNSLDLSNSAELQELYITHEADPSNMAIKFTSLDVSKCPKLYHLFATGNLLTEIDLSANPSLDHLWLANNRLSTLDISNSPDITSLHLSKNYFDFVTLPADRDAFLEYEYKQHPFQVPLSLATGTPLDLSSRVLREGAETYAALYSVSKDNPEEGVLVDESLYTYADGIITVHQAISDSVYVAYACSAFPETDLQTTKFMVKSAEDYGQLSKKMTFMPVRPSSGKMLMKVGMEGASASSPKKFYASYLNGTPQEFDITTSVTPESPNVEISLPLLSSVTLSVPEGEYITAIGIEDVTLMSCDVSAMESLRELTLLNTKLTSLDLSWNRCLRKIHLTGNNLSTFSIDGANGGYLKTTLEDVIVPGNGISEFVYRVPWFTRLDLSDNNITELDFTDAEQLKYLDVSNNKLTELKINYCSALEYLDASGNEISSYTAPETNVLQEAHFENNALTFATMPDANGLKGSKFTYAPQNPIRINSRAPGINLSAQNVSIDGKPVVFAWAKADGTLLTEGTDYTISDGRTRFINTSVGNVHAIMTCAALPDFKGDNALMTTEVLASEMPTNLIAEFETAKDGTASLSLASNLPEMGVYIDWTGDGASLEQYDLDLTYRLFEATTYADTKVKIYTYEPSEKVTVFSMTGAKLKNFDASAMDQLGTLTLTGAGTADITLPADKASLRELTLTENGITELDLTAYPNIELLCLNNNKLSTLDLSAQTKLQAFAASNNQLTTVKFAQNCPAWHVDLGFNKLTSFDMGALPELYQCALNDNSLRTLDTSAASALRVLTINKNLFDFTTLPLPKAEWVLYNYADQADIEAEIDMQTGSVDLSSQAMVGDVATVYRWWIDKPVLDTSTEEWTGEELVLDEEYTISGGVTTFTVAYDLRDVICQMTNETYPNVTLWSSFIDVAGGLQAVEADGVDAKALYYDLEGRRVANPASGNVYIVIRGSKVTKEVL